MKIKRFTALFMALILCVGVLTGCEQEKTDVFEPTRSSLYIRDDGTAAGAEITSFSEAYYSLAELKEYVEELVIAYNQEKAGVAHAYASDLAEGAARLPVAIGKLTEAKGNVTLILECATPADYIAINDLNLTSDGLKAVTSYTVEQMKAAGKSLSGSFIDVAGEAVTVDKVLKKDSYHVVVCEGATVLQVQGEIKYMSTNITYVNSATVETPAGEVSYIVYK